MVGVSSLKYLQPKLFQQFFFVHVESLLVVVFRFWFFVWVTFFFMFIKISFFFSFSMQKRQRNTEYLSKTVKNKNVTYFMEMNFEKKTNVITTIIGKCILFIHITIIFSFSYLFCFSYKCWCFFNTNANLFLIHILDWTHVDVPFILCWTL